MKVVVISHGRLVLSVASDGLSRTSMSDAEKKISTPFGNRT